MNTKFIVVDIGNTTIAVGIFSEKSESPIKTFRLSSHFYLTSDELYCNLQILLNSFEGDSVKAGYISVVPKLNKVVEDAFAKLGLLIKDVHPALLKSIKISYPNPQELGSDRLANALAAIKLYGVPAIVVDFGTAITLDYINSRGEYEGGVIAPGIELGLNALAKGTAKLPRIDFEVPDDPIGKSTTQAMQLGMFYSIKGLINETITRLNMKDNIKIIGAGGAVKILRRYIEFSHVDEYLTLKGVHTALRII